MANIKVGSNEPDDPDFGVIPESPVFATYAECEAEKIRLEAEPDGGP